MMRCVSLCLVLVLGWALPAAAEFFLREDFSTLDHWEHKKFPTDKPCIFRLEDGGEGKRVLAVVTQGSSSAMLSKDVIDLNATPVLRWRWKLSNTMPSADLMVDGKDDTPMRLWVFFDSGPELTSVYEKMKFLAMKAISGHSPRSALIYVWGNKEQTPRVTKDFESTTIGLVFQRKGADHVGQWVEEEVNILEDYRKAFGLEPNHRAKLMINGDGNDTGEGATVWFDWIEAAPAKGKVAKAKPTAAAGEAPKADAATVPESHPAPAAAAANATAPAEVPTPKQAAPKDMPTPGDNATTEK